MFDFVGGAWEFPYNLFKWTAIATHRQTPGTSTATTIATIRNPMSSRY